MACTREPDAVTEVCKNGNENLLLGNLELAIDALAVPANTTVDTTIQTSKTIRIIVRDTVNNNRVARVFDLYPPMARFCT